MAEFTYTALNSTGKEVKGNITADNREDALTKIKQKNLTPMDVKEATALNKSMEFGFLQKQPKARDMSVFCRQMVSILTAGIGIGAALEMLGEQTENKVLANAIRGCRMKIEGGSTFHDAMQDYKCMSGIFSTMIAAGEESGNLETSFTRMGDRFEKDEKTKALVKKATSYPKIVGIIAVAVVVFMLVFLVPKFEDMLGDMGTEMPAITKAVVGASRFVMKRFYIIIPIIVGIVIAIKRFSATTFGTHFMDQLKMKVPIFGNLTVKQACSNTMRTMATLLAAGIGMLDAMEITANTMTNVFYKEALLDAKVEVAQGTPFSEALERTKLFPPMIVHMVRIGEETGNLVGMFDRAADYYDEEVQQATEQVTAAIEPMVIVVLAGVVGTIIIALMAPMMSMYTGLDNL